MTENSLDNFFTAILSKDESRNLKWLAGALYVNKKDPFDRPALQHFCRKGDKLVACEGHVLFETPLPAASNIEPGALVKPVGNIPASGPAMFEKPPEPALTYPDTDVIKPGASTEKVRFAIDPTLLIAALKGFDGEATIVLHRLPGRTPEDGKFMLEIIPGKDDDHNHNYALVAGLFDKAIRERQAPPASIEKSE
jgi:hypothetical protein